MEESMKKFLTDSAVVIGTVVLGCAYAFSWGMGIEQLMWLATQVLIVVAIYTVIKDFETKLADKDMRKLLNWKDYVWSAGVLVATWFFGAFACSNESSAFMGWIFGIISALLYAGSLTFYVQVYLPSVMGNVAFDEYMRRKYAKRIAKAVRKGDQPRLVKYLGIVCRYHCTNDRYQDGSVYGRPFDDARKANYFELKRSKDASDRETADKMVKPYIELLASRMTSYNFEDVKAFDKADEAKKESK